MTQQHLGFFSRWGLALRVLFNGALAAELANLGDTSDEPAALPPAQDNSPPETPAVEQAQEKPPQNLGALHMLAILQREGRLIDFLQEDVTSVSDADIGGAARVVHEGCRKALAQYITLKPLRDEEEGSSITVPQGFDPAEIRLTGNVSGEPPYSGTLAHPGWRAVDTKLPDITGDHDASLVAPAEVEL